MAPERAAHLLAKAQAWRALQEALDRAGLSWTVFPDGATVRASPRAAYEPNALVACGEPVPPDAIEIPCFDGQLLRLLSPRRLPSGVQGSRPACRKKKVQSQRLSSIDSQLPERGAWLV